MNSNETANPELIPTSYAFTGVRDEDGHQDVNQEPNLVEEEVATGDNTLADPAVQDIA